MGWFSRRRPRDEFDAEVDAHIAMLAERFEARGMKRDEAISAARRQFGNVTALKERRNEMRPGVWLETLWQDLRYGARVLIKNKGFAAVAVLTLGLGIGANTAIFSVMNAAILRPLPYPDPGRLVLLFGNVKRVRVERRGASYPDFEDWRAQSKSFEAMAAFNDVDFALRGVERPDRIEGEYVSQPYFSMLGIHAALGRTFRVEEDQAPQRDAVAVLSDGAWKRRFGGDPDILGRRIQLDNSTFTVIGVAPEGFRGLTDKAEVWLPFSMMGTAEELGDRGSRGFTVLARLRAGVTPEMAQAELDTISSRLARTYPATNQSRGVEVTTLEREALGDVRKPLLVLLAAVGFVLLIASANVANLLLARSEVRRHEVAMRMALGASRGRLVRQLLAESAVMVALGCAAGLAAARLAIDALMAASPLRFPSFIHPTIDGTVALFTAGVCCVAALVFGIVPAAQTGSTGFDETLRQSGARNTGGRRGSRFRDVLVVAEISVSLVLLIGAGLLIRSLQRLAATDPGYDASHVVNFRVGLPRVQPATAAGASQPDAKVVAAANEILGRIAGLHGVELAAMGTDAPLTDGPAIFYTAEGQPTVDAQTAPRAYVHRASSGFFHALHARFLFGRSFTDEEIRDNANVAVVTDNMVRRFWPGQNPVGKRVKMGGVNSRQPWLTITGVVEQMKYRGFPANPTADPDLFLVFNERARDFSVLVRTSLAPSAMLSTIRTALRSADPSIIIYNEGTLEQLIGQETARPRFLGWLMGIFAGMALVLAVIGIYGVISYGVSKRTREIGLRMALGAERRDVLRMVVGRAVLLLSCGVVLGGAAAVALTRTIGTLVYQVSATDPVTFGAASVVLAAVGMVACVVPALRAARIDPATALREE